MYFKDIDEGEELLEMIDPFSLDDLFKRSLMPLIAPPQSKNLRVNLYLKFVGFILFSIEPKWTSFIIAHVFGWLAQPFCFCDVWICWILSVMFEYVNIHCSISFPISLSAGTIGY